MKIQVKHILIILFAGILFASCEDFLVEDPQNFISPEIIFNNAHEADIALNGVYDGLGKSSTGSSWGLYSANFLIIDQGTSTTTSKVGETNENQAAFAHYLLTPEQKTVNEIWQNSFAVIQRANMVINRVSQINDNQISSLERNRIMAEARFIRALLNFNLVRLFGGIPVLTEELLNIDNVYVSRDKVEDVYAQIIEDFEFGTENLFFRNGSVNAPSLGTEFIGKATRGAAYGMLSKVYLTLASTKKYALHVYNSYGPYADYSWVDATVMYQNAADYAAVLDTLSGVSLAEHYDDNFMLENTSESLFEVQIGPDVDEQAHIGVWSGTKHPDKYYVDFGYVRISPYAKFTDSFIKNWAVDSTLDKSNSDYRYTWNIGSFQYKVNDENGEKITYRENLNNKKAYGYRKYRKTEQFEYLDNTNFRVLRYADVLLMHAEALNELGDVDGAVALMNKVRERARRGSDYAYTKEDGDYPVSNEPADIATGLSQDSIMKLIKLERGWELCYEGHGRYDDMRWGILENSVKQQVEFENNTKGANYEYVFYVDGRNLGGTPTTTPLTGALNFNGAKHWLLPIPQFEVDLNPNLEQNVNW